MLPQIEKDEARTRLAAVSAAAPTPAPPAPSPVKTASLPASTPGTSYTPPPVVAPTAKPVPAVSKPAPALSTPAAVAAANAANEATTAAAVAKGEPVKIASTAPKPAPTAAKPAPQAAKPVTVHNGTSPWRAQFGAFGVEANARSLWASLERKYPALAARQPSYVKAGTVTRLQAGGFASKGDAENLCVTVRKGGQACMVVSK